MRSSPKLTKGIEILTKGAPVRGFQSGRIMRQRLRDVSSRRHHPYGRQSFLTLVNDAIAQRFHGWPKRERYSVEIMNALTISALTKSPLKVLSFASQN